MKKLINKKIEYELLTDLLIGVFLLIFALTYFYIDPSVTSYSIFEINVADTEFPNITVNSPLNNSNLSYTNITFNITAEEVNLIQNISIFGNWTGSFIRNITNSSSNLANNQTIFVINISQGRGFYLWNAQTCDNSSNCNFSLNMTLFINRIPEITSINISNDHSANKSTGNLTGKFNYLDADNDVQSLNETRWYNNTMEITAFKNITNISFSNLTFGDNWIFSARVFDGESWSLWYNSSGHSIQNNTAPVFSGLIPNQTWFEDTYLTNVITLSDYFSDQESDNLSYIVLGQQAINVTINETNVSFSQVQDFYSVENIVFEANDGNLTRQSNNITLTVTPTDEPPQVSTSNGGSRRVNSGVEIISPTLKTIFLKDKIKMELIVRNKGDTILQGIRLNSSSENQNIKTSLDKEFISNLIPGSEDKLLLEIVSNLKKEEPVKIIISALVDIPELKDSTNIYLNAVEFGAANKSVIIPRLQYAKDLFNKKNECKDLIPLIEKAESMLNKENLNEAQSLIEKAINGCNDIILLIPKKIEISKSKSNEQLIFISEMIILFVLTISLFVYYKKRKSNLKEI